MRMNFYANYCFKPQHKNVRLKPFEHPHVYRRSMCRLQTTNKTTRCAFFIIEIFQNHNQIFVACLAWSPLSVLLLLLLFLFSFYIGHKLVIFLCGACYTYNMNISDLKNNCYANMQSFPSLLYFGFSFTY